LLKQLNQILKTERITGIAGIDEIKEIIGLRVWNDSKDHTKVMNCDKVDMNDKEHQKRTKK
jgi:hypothetical protein